ncbi:MAG: response regulator transcription factor [Caulobacteraceae bacterium]|nr:response regulator transcription factor [Caulobacteraceae bacterium]
MAPRNRPEGRNPDDEPVVLVVDDDEDLRESLESLLRSVDLRVVAFPSARAFLEADLPHAPCCLLLDVRMPDLSGLDLQAELAREEVKIPIVFMTAHGDVPMAVKALRSGAINFLTKPFRDQDLLDAIKPALEMARRQHEEARRRSDIHARFAEVTSREREVLGRVLTGRMNKQIAFDLGISEVTVKIHRGNLMRKLGARSMVDLIAAADALGLREKG